HHGMSRMRILIVVHGFPPSAQGGSEIYAHAQARALAARDGDDVLGLTRDNDPARPEYAVRRERSDRRPIVRTNNTVRPTRSFQDSYRNEAVGAIAAAEIEAFVPDVAHIHHLTCLSTTIVDTLAARGTPVFYTLHDYWLMCHRGQLLDTDYRLCDGPGPAGCDRCLGSAAAAP